MDILKIRGLLIFIFLLLSFYNVNAEISSLKLEYSTDKTDVTLTWNYVITCTPKWECSEYNECVDGKQTRTCEDVNECDNNEGKPEEEQSCIVPCTNECSENEKECSGDGYRVCNDNNGDGCFEWGSVTSCSSTEICENGACVCNPNWQCTSWSRCEGKQQTRTCNDLNNCSPNENQYTEVQLCNELTGAVIGDNILTGNSVFENLKSFFGNIFDKIKSILGLKVTGIKLEENYDFEIYRNDNIIKTGNEGDFNCEDNSCSYLDESLVNGEYKYYVTIKSSTESIESNSIDVTISVEEEQPIEEKSSCNDTDNGKDYNVTGTCTDSSGKDPLTDSNVTTDEGDRLEEFYCDEKKLCSIEIVECEFGYGEGVCLEKVIEEENITVENEINETNFSIEESPATSFNNASNYTTGETNYTTGETNYTTGETNYTTGETNFTDNETAEDDEDSDVSNNTIINNNTGGNTVTPPQAPQQPTQQPRQQESSQQASQQQQGTQKSQQESETTGSQETEERGNVSDILFYILIPIILVGVTLFLLRDKIFMSKESPAINQQRDRMVNFIREIRAKGYSDDAIKQKLYGLGYSEGQVEDIFKRL